MNSKNFKTKIENKEIEIKFKNWATQASGSCMVKCGNTEVLVTSSMSSKERKDISFFPLMVHYEERYYAAGEIYGSRFIRREGKPTDQAVLTARMIDRTIRPRFPESFRREVQVIPTCLSWDGENDPDIISALGTSISLLVSEIPWDGPISMVRVAEVDGKLILNPTYEQKEKSSFDLILSGIEEDGKILINMIEAGAEEVSEKKILEAVKKAKPAIKKLIDLQKEIQKKIGKDKIEIVPDSDPEVEKKAKKFLEGKLEDVLFQKDNLKSKEKSHKLKQELIDYIEKEYPNEEKTKYALDVLEKEKKNLIQNSILKDNKRPDGRTPNQLREISSQVEPVSSTHGSALFCRGLTKILSILTLGGPGDYQILEGMEVVGKKRFLHHYNFPPFSVGETKPLRAPSRREIGHGRLAEKALEPMIPDFDNFSYTIRVVSEALSSNGSTSMGSVCATSLALMDGGVPIKRPVAGIAIGLVKNSKQYKILTDIQGPEDAFGGMDFKVAGTEKGITAIQLDVKIEGLTQEIIKESLQKAKKARLEILKNMKKTIASPRKEVSPSAPRITTLQVNPEKIGDIIGPKGATIKEITEECDVEIDIEDSGLVYITAKDKESNEKAVKWIKKITEEVEPGKVYKGKVTRIEDYGAFVEVLPGKKGLVHISNFAPYRIDKVENVVKIGDKIPVKVTGIDERGRIDLSAKEAGFRPKKNKKKKKEKK